MNTGRDRNCNEATTGGLSVLNLYQWNPGRKVLETNITTKSIRQIELKKKSEDLHRRQCEGINDMNFMF